MPVARLISIALLSALVLLGCRNESPTCPVGTITSDPREIPDGTNQTNLFVEVNNPFPDNGLAVVTELSALTGAIGDPSARETTYTCPFDFSGEAEVCVTTTYEDGVQPGLSSDVASAEPKLRGPNVFLQDPLECSTTECTVVVCPEEKNVCPEVSSLAVDPDELEEGETATVTVIVEDPDDNPPGALMTTLSARDGTIANPSAQTTTYMCDPDVGGIIPICVLASDGDPSCDVERCSTVLCPGEPDENTCPIIESVTANPMEVPSGETMTTVRAVATNPDNYPLPLRVDWSSETGVFGDRFATETTFTCGAPGPVKICAKANDGDQQCNETRCTTVQCPTEIPKNRCPMLFVINGVPRVIADGEISTLVQTRGQDADGLPFSLTLTLSALWGSFEDTENIQEPFNVVSQDATYTCDRPGPVEVCVDATDGACTKTLCDNIVCPDDIPTPP